jgi:hypothetical protein
MRGKRFDASLVIASEFIPEPWHFVIASVAKQGVLILPWIASLRSQ